MAQLFADAARAYLSAGIAAGDTTISISSGGMLFPVANGTDWFKAVLQDASGIEIVYVTAHASAANTFTVTRGQEGTTARAFAAGSVFGLRVTAADMVGFAAKLAEAPSDGKTYGRKDGAWVEVVGGNTYHVGDVQIAPTTPTTGTWLKCDGAVYLQSSYAALYAQLGLIVNSPGYVGTDVPTTTPADAWSEIAYGNGVYVAVSAGTASTSKIMTSPDGVNWTLRSTPTSQAWAGVAFGSGIFVAPAKLGAPGTNVYVTSADGITWTERTLPVSWDVASISFCGGYFFVTRNVASTAVYRSADGLTWTALTTPVSAWWSSVAYGGSAYVMIASANSSNANTNISLTSADATTWVQRALPTAAQWRKVVYGEGDFVASASSSNAQVASSPDGISWTGRTLPSTDTWVSLSYGNGAFLLSSIGGAVVSSPDGVAWFARPARGSSGWYAQCFGGNKFVAVRGSGSVGVYSYAGINYNPSTQFAVPRAISTDINSWVKAA